MEDIFIRQRANRLRAAIVNGRCDEVKELLPKCGTSVLDSRDPDTLNTPLILACTVGCFTCVKNLVLVAVDVHAQNAEGKTPLHVALQNGEEEIAQFLIKEVIVSHSIQDIDGATPLHLAAVYPNKYFLQQILMVGGDPCNVDHEGDSPLHWAVREGLADHLQLLVSHSPKAVHVQNLDGESPVDLAKEFGEEQMLHIMSGACGDTMSEPNSTPVNISVQSKSKSAASSSGGLASLLQPFGSEKFFGMFSFSQGHSTGLMVE